MSKTISIGSIVKMEGYDGLFIVERFYSGYHEGRVLVRREYGKMTIAAPFDGLEVVTKTRNVTPYQRGLLRSLKRRAIEPQFAVHLKPGAVRAVNCLIRKGYAKRLKSGEIRITRAGRFVDTSD